MARLFADTYALIEILRGNPSYEAYSQAKLVATEFNILELTYALVRDFGRDETANVTSFIRSHSLRSSTDRPACFKITLRFLSLALYEVALRRPDLLFA